MNKISIKFIAESAIIAALYVALTWVFAPISYGPIQFRISEILILLVVFNPKYAVSLIIGCFIANTTSSLGWYDMVFGTLATILAIIPMCIIRKMPIAAIFPVVSNAFIVSIELGFAFENWGLLYWYNVWTVGLGELVVLYFLGIPVMSALANNETLCEKMELDSSKAFKIKIASTQILSIALGVLGIILFIAYPMYKDSDDAYVSMMMVARDSYLLWVVVGLCIIYSLVAFLKDRLKAIIGIIVGALFIVPYALVGIFNTKCFTNFYYYIYLIYPILCIILPFYYRKK